MGEDLLTSLHNDRTTVYSNRNTLFFILLTTTVYITIQTLVILHSPRTDLLLSRDPHEGL